MSTANRIDPTSTALTGTRQTPKDSFGELFAQAGVGVMSAGATVLSAVATGNPVVSAAVSGIKTVIGAATTKTGASSSDGTGGGQGSDAMELMQMQQAMQAEGFKLNTVYLGMQREMQRESREFSAISNIMKVRHDTAKSAINNVR